MGSRVTVSERFWAKVEKTSGCWIWTGTRVRGYGQFSRSRRDRVYAHRFAYEEIVGPIPEGLTLDHLCRNKACVNPDHLEVVSQRENSLRGEARNYVTIRTGVCPRGHAFAGANVYLQPNGKRACRACRLERGKRYRLNGNVGCCGNCGEETSLIASLCGACYQYQYRHGTPRPQSLIERASEPTERYRRWTLANRVTAV